MRNIPRVFAWSWVKFSYKCAHEKGFMKFLPALDDIELILRQTSTTTNDITNELWPKNENTDQGGEKGEEHTDSEHSHD